MAVKSLFNTQKTTWVNGAVNGIVKISAHYWRFMHEKCCKIYIRYTVFFNT